MDRGAWQATVYGGHKTVGHDLATEQQLGKKTLSPYKLLTKSRFNILGGNETETERESTVCLQYLCLVDLSLSQLWGSVKDGEAWRASVYGIIKSQT